MCGLAGIYNLQNVAPPRREELERMIRAIRHRGPDGNGFQTLPRAGLAHARLSIIDLDGGAQPIFNEDRTISVVFNGEIFNYRELRRDLERHGHRFYTHSDTEVIVHLYETYGDDFVHELNGQFAIALWDDRQQRLVLARDRVGIRPLFYSTQNGRLLFASEIKSLFALPEVPRRLAPQALSQVFTFWSVQPPATIFEDIQSLPPGSILTAEGERVHVRRYWDWTFPDRFDCERSPESYAEELRALLIDAVRLQLRADVPVGAYLSGGLDSSVVTSLIKHYTDTPLRTFSIGFDEAEFDEGEYQNELVAYLGTAHSAVRCGNDDIGRSFPRALWHAETPLVRTAPTPLLLLSGHVRAQGYKVVLTGEGADEVFAGYDLFKEAKIRRFWARDPGSRLRPLALKRLYPYLKNSPTAGGAYTELFFKQGMERAAEPYFAHIPRWSTTQRARQFLSDDMRAASRDWDPYGAIAAGLPASINAWHPLNRDQYVEAHTLMSSYLLCSQGDRVASANAVEARFPFLDHRIIEFANRAPPHYKLRGLTEKYLLKKAMRGLLPERIRTRTKQPYRAPDSRSFFSGGAPLGYVAELLSPARLREAGYFEPAAVQKLVEKCRHGRAIGFADNMAFVGILSTMVVDALYVRPASVATEFPADHFDLNHGPELARPAASHV